MAAKGRDDDRGVIQFAYRGLALAKRERRFYRRWLYIELGYAFWHLEQLPEAEVCLRNAVQIGPRNDLASIGLYFVLKEQWRTAGKVEDAFREIVRFLELGYGKRHADLLTEITSVANVSAEVEELLARARQLLRRWM